MQECPQRCVDPVFAGREDEHALLGNLVGQLVEGHGRVVWVTGEAGIGKTALVTTGLAAVRARGCDLYAAAAPKDPWAAPVQLLRDAFAPGSQEDPGPTVEAWLGFIGRCCARTPTILFADDAQWADEASLAVIGRLARQVGQLPLLLVIAARTGLDRPALRALRDAVDDADPLVLELGPLGPADGAQAVRQLLGVPPGPALAAQLAAAGGNPEYLRELLDALIRDSRLRMSATAVELTGDGDELPPSLPAAIERRLPALSERTRSALRVAAVLGPTFAVEDVGTVTGLGPTALVDVAAEASTTGILADRCGVLSFRHGVVHHALYRGLPAGLRTALHLQVAAALASAGTPVERVAAQLLSAAPLADAWIVDWTVANAAALTRIAPVSAVELLARIRDLLPRTDARRDQLSADLAAALLRLGRPGEVERIARPAITGTRDPGLAARLAWLLATAQSRLGHHDEAVEIIGRALTGAGLPPEWAARLLGRRALSALAAGLTDDARTDAAQAEAAGTTTGDCEAIGTALAARARIALRDRRAEQALALIDRALGLVGDEPEAIDLAQLLRIDRTLTLTLLARPDEAELAWAQAEACGRIDDSGHAPGQGRLAVYGALAALLRGQLDAARTRLAAAAHAPLTPVEQTFRASIAELVGLHGDDRSPATRAIRGSDATPPVAEGLVPVRVNLPGLAAALASERDGRPAAALARLVAVFDPDGDRRFAGLDPLTVLWLPNLVRLALAAGEAGLAGAATSAGTAVSGAGHSRGLLVGDPEQLADAATELTTRGLPLFAALALEDAACGFAGRGDRRPARAAHAQAVAIYEQAAAAWDVRRVDARLRTFGIRRGRRGPRVRAETGWAALTPTEQSVARLVADGLSNPDIAAHLVVSRYTIQSHISHILTKLEVRSRIDIARLAG